MTEIRVVLAEDHAIVRKGLRLLIDQYPGITVIAEAANGREAVIATERLRPDVVVMDFSMPGLNGLDASRQIRQRAPNTKILVLTRHEDKEYIKSILKAGATGYLIKKSAADELVLAIQAVYQGDIFIDPSISSVDIEGLLNQSGPGGDKLKITPRQAEVLQLIAEGKPNRDIAPILNISVRTVENHRSNLLKILGLHTTADLVQYAIRNKMINLDE